MIALSAVNAAYMMKTMGGDRGMTPKQKENYNRMLHALKTITAYQTPDYLRKHSFRDWGLDDPNEAIEMAYENIQQMAKDASKGIREIK